MIPPQLIAAAIGAAIGAGKTALNKKERKDPMSWVKNTLGGAAAGAAGGAGAGSAGAAALGGLKGGASGVFGFPMPGGGMGDGDFGGTPPIVPPMPKGGPVLFGQVQQDGMPPLQDGEFDYDDPSIPGGLPRPGEQGPLEGRVEKGQLSPKAQAAVELLKSYINRPRPTQVPAPLMDIAAPNPIQLSLTNPYVLSQMQVPQIESLMMKRRRY